MLQVTPADHIEWNDLKEAITLLEKTNVVLEMSKETAEKFERVLQINYSFADLPQELIDSSFVEWIREGPLLQVNISGPEKCYVYLLTDALLVAQFLPDETKRYQTLIKLQNTTLREVNDSPCNQPFPFLLLVPF
jgi:hypothetical protein